MSRLRIYANWLVPLAISVVAWGATVWVAGQEEAHHGDVGVLLPLAGGLMLVGTLVAAVVTVRNAWRTRTAIRNERILEAVRIEREREHLAGVQTARCLALHLMTGRSLDPLTVWGLVLRPSETAHLDLTADLSRPVAMPTGKYAWTRPMPVQVIVSNRRLLLHANCWQSVWYDDLVGFYPEMDDGRLVMDVARGGPIQLSGPASAAVAVYVVAMLYGSEGIRRHPTLASLLR